MAATTSLDGGHVALEALLERAGDGRLQVPEFQRDFMLQDDWVKSLLGSVSLGYPIGAVTVLETGGPDARFGFRPVAGSLGPSIRPEWLLVDGQQRVTCLYQALASGQPVGALDAEGRLTPRWYYLDVEAALDPGADRDDAVVSLPVSRGDGHAEPIGHDVGAVELEWERLLFPLRLVFGDDAERRRWRRGFAAPETDSGAASRRALMARFDATVLDSFERYAVPVIRLGRETTRWTVGVHGGPDGRGLSDRFRAAADRGTRVE